MSLLDMLFEQKQAEQAALLKEQQMGILRNAYGSTPSEVTTTGSMRSYELDEAGRQIGLSQTEQAPRTEQEAGTGLLGNPNDRESVAKFRMAALNAGISGGDANSMIADTRTTGVFENKNQQLTANRNMSQDFKKEVNPFRAKAQYYDDTLALGNYQDWKGTDDFIAMRNLLKQSLPNESVMGDDLQNLTTSGGMPAWASSMVAKLGGKGMIGQTARKDLMNTLYKNAQQSRKYSDEIRASYQERASKVPGLNTEFMMKPIVVQDYRYEYVQNKDGTVSRQKRGQ